MHETKIIVNIKTSEKIDARELYEIMVELKTKIDEEKHKMPETIRKSRIKMGEYIEDGEQKNVLDTLKKAME